MVCTILSANPFIWGWYGSVLYGLHPIFSNYKLRSSSQNSGELSDTRVFGMPFLENMTFRISFIAELFLSGAQITLGHPEKDSTSINCSPTPVMYALSIYTRFHGDTSLDYECKVVRVKYFDSLHFLHLFIYSSTSREYPAFHACNFMFFFCVCGSYSTTYIILHTFYHQLSLRFWEIIRSLLQITPCSIVNLSYFFVGFFRPGTISPFFFSYSRCYPT